MKDFQPYSSLWLTTRTWYTRHQAWTTGPWEELSPEELDGTFEQCLKAINQVARYFKDKGFPKISANAAAVKAAVDDFKPQVPLALALRKEGMEERHWDQLSAAVGFDVRPVEGFTLTTLVDKGLLGHAETAEEVGERAFKEHHIEVSLRKMQAAWVGLDFVLPQFKATTTCYISGFEDAVQMLDEHIVTTQAMQFSPFKKPFEEEIEQWATALMLVSDTLEEWVKCQGQWMYLQPIFDSPDIMKQLPQETKRFKSVDSTWRQQINVAKASPAILQCCGKEGLKEKFQEANKNLEIVQKGLADYLEKKRSVFARFYFLSNDELLEILSQTKEVRNVRPHLRKVFEAIADLVFQDDDTMLAMISAEGEKVDFVKKVDPRDRNVEYWMGDVEKMMTTSVRSVLHHSIEDYLERPRTEWVRQHSGMCVLNGSQVHWTSDVDVAIRDKGVLGVKEYHEFLERQLSDSVLLVRQKLSKQAKLTLNALIVIDVHAKDVVGTLVRNEVDDVGAFEWISQLRYYWEADDCYVKCVQTRFPYGYEYLGNSMRLVITPLTDKCYMTLMGALNLNLGGAPAGPAGTGKTESTKDLAKALAKQCVVFNCSDGMDHIMVAKFFKGLASAGAWACFDEFNRINIEVLSVIAQQLLVLFGAKGRQDPEIVFEESLIKMKPTFSVFITMNPGYAGRTELPDNLKALFRPVAMMVPDYALIGEIMLYSFGFLEGRGLAKKMVTTFTLSSEQLSSQDHYDYGMRAVRSVINAAGLLKADHPDTNEQQLLLRALRDVNVPKFLKDDIPLFENIILDLFPGLERPAVDYGDLEGAISASCAHYNVQEVGLFIAKILQLYYTIQVRHGLMIVGPTGGGKSSNYRVLQHAMSALAHQERFEKVHVDVLNPKSITMGQLYGYVDPQTTEWVDGVLAKLVLDCTKDESPDKHWVMFDGPVDALWIENMNTVLDDNKKLCLNSGQIITLTPRMTMMFEVEDLAVASPATVSRCGMVYMEPASLGLAPYFTSWLNTLPPRVAANPAARAKLQALGDDFLEDACYFLRHDLTEPVGTVDNNLLQSLFRLLDCYLADYVETEVKKVSAERVEELITMLPQLWTFALVWSVGTTTTLPGREKFDKWLRPRLPKAGVTDFPEAKLVYDYQFDRTTKAWVSWFDTVRPYTVDVRQSFNEIVVPTLDSIRMKYLVALCLTAGKHVLTPGPTGTGKSVNTAEMLTYELPEEY